MKRMAKAVALAAGCIGLVFLAALVFAVFFDWNRARPAIDDLVSGALHRPFSINGPLVLTWSREGAAAGPASGWRNHVPWPHIDLQDVTLGNPASIGASAPEFLTIHHVAFSLDPLALLQHRIKIPALVLQQAELHAVRTASGANNWTFEFDATPSPWSMELRRVVIDDGRVNLHDPLRKLELALAVDTFDDGGPESYGISWTIEGSYNAAPVKGAGKGGAVLSLQDAKPYPLEAELKVGKTSVQLKGSLTKPSDLAALDLQMDLSGASMADLYPLTGIALPNTPPFSTHGRLIGSLDRHGSTWQYERFSGRVGSSDLSGQLKYESAREHGRSRPYLEGNLVSNLLVFKDLAPSVGADQRPQETRSDGKSVASGKVLPTEEFKFTRWRDIDADVKFTGRKIIKDDKLPLDNMVVHFVLRDGTLSLLPLEFGVAEGHMTSNVTLNGNGPNIKGDMTLSARHLKLNRLMPDFKPMQTSLGEINGDAKIRSSGNSVAGLLAASDGELKVLVSHGTVSKLLLDEAGLNVLNVILIKVFGDKQVQLNCVAGDFVITGGLLHTQYFLIDTDEASIGVDGQVDLAKETLALTVQPENKKFRLVSLRSPVYVSGTFAAPQVNIDKGKVALRTGGALALGVLTPVAALLPLVDVGPGKDSGCAKVLLDAKEKVVVPTSKRWR
jgi:hypothetical protein